MSGGRQRENAETGSKLNLSVEINIYGIPRKHRYDIGLKATRNRGNWTRTEPRYGEHSFYRIPFKTNDSKLKPMQNRRNWTYIDPQCG